MQKITPCLWFDKQAEEAAKFYTSIFKNSKIRLVTHYGKEGYEIHGMKAGTVMTVVFELEGQEFMAMNGGPLFTFSPAVSLIVNCKTQKELDEIWKKLSADEKAEQCGWLRDKYGLSWQIVPAIMEEMFRDTDTRKTDRVMKALLQMKKLDIETLKQAYQVEKKLQAV